MQVQQETDVEWSPLAGEQVVQGRAITGELLLAPAPQHRRLVVDDLRCARGVRNDDSFEC